MDAMIETVLGSEIGRREIRLARFLKGAIQGHHIAPGAEGLVATALEPDGHHPGIHRPGIELVGH